MSLNEDIIRVVTNNLPAIQVEILKKELDKASLCDHYQKRVEDLATVNEEQKTKIDVLLEYKRQNEGLEKREIALALRERQLEIDLLKKDIKCLENTNYQLKELMHAAFKNTTQKRYINGTNNNSTICTSTNETTEHE